MQWWGFSSCRREGRPPARRDLTDEICGSRQRTPAPTRACRSFRICEPRLLALTPDEQREAVALLADLLAAAAAKRRPGVMGGALDGVSGSASPGVRNHAEKAERAGGAE